MPTGVAMRDARQQLFDAAERVLLRDGPSAVTSRAVTTEAGCAKGVLHRHFADFDEFLAELVRDRIERLNVRATLLTDAAGAGTVVGNLAAALMDAFTPIAMRILGLVVSRDELRARLRETTPKGVPLLMEAVRMVRVYLDAERGKGRIAADADTAMVAPMVLGAVQLRFADREDATPDEADIAKIVAASLGPILR